MPATPLPPPYTRQTSFTDWEANHPGEPATGTSLDAEFNAVQVSLTDTQARLALIQRDDGALANAAVGPDQLAPEVIALIGGGFVPRGAWAPGVVYAVGDAVEVTGTLWAAVVKHVSAATFAADEAAGYWMFVSQFIAAPSIPITPIPPMSATTVQGALEALNAFDVNLGNQADPAKGSDMVGFADPKAPAYLKTVSDILNAGKVSVMRFIPRTAHAALYAGTSSTDFTANFQEAFAAFNQGGELILPPVAFNTNGLEIVDARNFKISGSGWKSKIKNNNVAGKHAIYVRGDTIDDRTYGFAMESFTIEGNPLSGDGIRLDRMGWYDSGTFQASVTNLTQLQVMLNGKNGIQVGRSASEGAGNSVKILGSFLTQNGRTGLVGIGQTNMISLLASAVTSNTVDGVELNQVASTNTVSQTFIADNLRYGVFAFRCEQPLVCYNGFNRNMQGGVAFSGDPTGSIKYTEAGLILGNLFGDNGRSAAVGREISIYSSKGTNILANYFYGTGQESMIYLSDYAEGVLIRGSHWKDLTTEVKLEIKPGAINLSYTFDDDVNGSTIHQITTNNLTQYIVPSYAGLFQTRGAVTDSAPRFLMNGDGSMSFGPGTSASDVTLSRAVAGSLRVSGGLQASTLMVADGIATPNASTGYARIFVDSADGLIKIRFSSGVVKTFTVT